MKQTWKKLIGLVLIGVCVLAMTACGGEKKTSGSLSELDETTENMLIENLGSVLQSMSQLDESMIESFLAGDDVFSASAAHAWDSNGKALGAFVEVTEGKVDTGDKNYTVILNAKFEKREATCTFTLDKNGQPTGVTLEPYYTMGDKMTQAAQNTVMGVGIVFIMLVFLSFVISLMKFIPGFVESFGKKKAAAPAEVNTAAPAAVPAAEEEEELVDDGELIAVIAAAIAASENTSTDSFVVRSIRKSTKRNWQRA